LNKAIGRGKIKDRKKGGPTAGEMDQAQRISLLPIKTPLSRPSIIPSERTGGGRLRNSILNFPEAMYYLKKRTCCQNKGGEITERKRSSM